MGESECDYKGILKSVKSKVTIVAKFETVCFLNDQIGRKSFKSVLNLTGLALVYELRCFRAYWDLGRMIMQVAVAWAYILPVSSMMRPSEIAKFLLMFNN